MNDFAQFKFKDLLSEEVTNRVCARKSMNLVLQNSNSVSDVARQGATGASLAVHLPVSSKRKKIRKK